jgi:hypothetical protein
MFSIRSLLALLARKRKSRPENLPPEVLAAAVAEARKLKGNHGVDVKPLSAGELPIPRRADD